MADLQEYQVKAPDGHIITLRGPKGASQDEVVEQAKKLYTPKPSLRERAGKLLTTPLIPEGAVPSIDPQAGMGEQIVQGVGQAIGGTARELSSPAAIALLLAGKKGSETGAAKDVGAFMKGAAPKPKFITRGMESVKESRAARSGMPKADFDNPPGLVKKQALKFTPSKAPSSPAYGTPKVKSSGAGGSIKEQSDLPSGDFPNRGKLKEQLLKTAPTQRTGGVATSSAPRKYGRFTQEPPAEPSSPESTPAPSGIPQEIWDSYKPHEQERIMEMRRKAQGQAKAPPPEASTGRGSRASEEKQTLSDKIAVRNRVTKELAQKHVAEGGPRSSQLAIMPDSEKSAFMKQHGLKNDADWFAYLHNLSRLEK